MTCTVGLLGIILTGWDLTSTRWQRADAEQRLFQGLDGVSLGMDRGSLLKRLQADPWLAQRVSQRSLWVEQPDDQLVLEAIPNSSVAAVAILDFEHGRLRRIRYRTWDDGVRPAPGAPPDREADFFQGGRLDSSYARRSTPF
ncbi:MAG: hypothetical protein AB7S38_27515 [Vulcanimicrobiota bacterium]